MAVSDMVKNLTCARAVLAMLALAAVALCGWAITGCSTAQQENADGASSFFADEPSTLPECPVDLAALKADYPETVGWIQMDDIDLSYPVMQAADNAKYLEVDSQGNASIDGSIFLDYRTQDVATDLYAIVYGHNMLDGSMFGSLNRYTDEAWFKGVEGSFTYFTLDGAYRYKIFSVAIVDAEDDVYQMGFADRDAFAEFVEGLKKRSMFVTGVSVDAEDTVMTLSTCSDTNRLVLCAKRL